MRTRVATSFVCLALLAAAAVPLGGGCIVGVNVALEATENVINPGFLTVLDALLRGCEPVPPPATNTWHCS